MIDEKAEDALREACGKYRDTQSCALNRLAQYKGVFTMDLQGVAETIGLTQAEAEGVMDGWDVQTGYSTNGIFRWAYDTAVHTTLYTDDQRYGLEHRAEYEAGRALGIKLASEFWSRPEHPNW